MRLEAVLLIPHVAVVPSEFKRAGAIKLFAMMGGPTAPIYHLYVACRALNGQVASALVAPFLASAGALRERKGASDAWRGS